MEFLRILPFQSIVVFLLFTVVYFPLTVRSDEVIPLLLPSDQVNDICPTKPSQTESSCTVNCFRPDPVCGVNGVTYWCGCPDAQCAGVRVVKLGICEVGNGGSAPVTGQALLLVHIVWLVLLGFVGLFGLL
ncbi:putative calcium-dependent protein kinase 17-like [Capsicum annuum]|uniref:Serine-type endopeptidase inhibitor n=1 Tax=Capsicum annuum TaxID=4072 RepID=A0A1U8G8U3_CAPAN|nr:uncharacterized protein LOC107866080 [Capsicum annuum]KAF3658687.1 putative calcium-dependent protein kinase 17-like [Capsicum annuum]PHT87630.1 hypothetical protein T459_09736 [Capsicum annuum]